MNDLVAVAFIGGGCSVIAAAIPSVIGLTNRRLNKTTADHAYRAAVMAESVAATVGDSNGNGDVVNMLSSILAWQDAHAANDLKRMDAIEAELAALGVYTHARFHDVLNALTGTKGRTDLLWERFIKEQESETQ